MLAMTVSGLRGRRLGRLPGRLRIDEAAKVHVQPGPRPEQFERKQRAYAEPGEADISAPAGRHLQVEDAAFAGLEIVDPADDTVDVNLQVRSAILRVIRDRDSELCGLAGEHRVDARERDFEAYQVPLALVHRNEANADQQEGQYERQVVVVVHRAEQHRECHQPEDESDRRRQDVDAAGVQLRDGFIDALASPRPAPNPGAGLIPVGREP